MKKIVLLIALCALILVAYVWAVDFRADLSIKTGDASLDLHLRNVNEKASTPAGAVIIRNDLKQNFSLTDKELAFLSKRGYTLAEINYLTLLAKHTGKTVYDVAALHSKGIGWGVLAQRLGVRPSDLNKLRVQHMKQEKVIVKEQSKEQVKIKMHAPETKGPAGVGHGAGKGKGR